MRTTTLRWLVLLLLPGCLLVQPLDEAKPDDEASAGGGNSPSQAGSAGRNTAGSAPSAGGSGNRAGSGPVPPGGSGPAPAGGNGGAPSGVDFSLFLGTWTITGGKNTISCDGSTPQTTNTTPGGMDEFGLGTVSDLIFDPGSECEILTDVDDRTAYLHPATEPCTTSDSDFVYDLTVDSFEFVVSGNGQTAKASMSSTILVTDANFNLSFCESDYVWDYQRGPLGPAAPAR